MLALKLLLEVVATAFEKLPTKELINEYKIDFINTILLKLDRVKIEKDFNQTTQSKVTIVLTNKQIAISRFFLFFIDKKTKVVNNKTFRK